MDIKVSTLSLSMTQAGTSLEQTLQAEQQLELEEQEAEIAAVLGNTTQKGSQPESEGTAPNDNFAMAIKELSK